MLKYSFIIFAFLWVSYSYTQQSYYDDVNLNVTGLTLKNELSKKITTTHTQFLFYEQIWGASQITDVNPNNNQKVLLIYGFENGVDGDVTNDRTRGINNNSGGSGTWNREHIYSQSLGTPPLAESGPGADAHHLRPADSQRNSSRSNRKFTTGFGNSGIQTNGGWYPGDEWKGDVARMMMYMYVRYDDRCLPSNIGFGSNANTPDDMIDLFLQWNVEDPVSDFERQRNTYHANTNNENAQGNRNPFIDNPILATRIWGGPLAEDTWGIYTSSDTEAPTIPQNLISKKTTTFSVDLSWDPATDNSGVTSYDVYVNNKLEIATDTTFIRISNLNPNTNYIFNVLAKDIANNASALSNSLTIKTLQDTEAPSVPQNLSVSNQTETSFIIAWNAATDNTKLALYEVYVDDILNGTTTSEMYTVTGLTTLTTYKITVLAVDSVGNKSNLSSPLNAATTNGLGVATELFFSEYIEGSSNIKALEIVNLTNNDIDLGTYSIQRQSNGGINGDGWEFNLPLSGTIESQSVYVIVNEAAGESSSSSDPNVAIAGQFLIDVADFIQIHNGDTNFGAPINFNGNDPVGLFKNGVLIDIIGTFNGGTSNFAKDKTLRRKKGISQPNTTFDIGNEWDTFPKNTVDDFGKHSTIVLSTKSFENNTIQVYPNPAKDFISIENLSNKKMNRFHIINLLGKKIFEIKNPFKEINIQNLPKGMYILKFKVENQLFSSKFIKN